ncbi:MAG: radical SAM protein [bacterium]|nr:radical SAM protein [bacterium]
MIDILFINPPLNNEKRLGDFASIGSHNPPINLLYLSAVTEKNGFKTQILDAEAIKFSIGLTVQEILKIEPKFLAITAMTLSIETAFLIAKKVKAANKEIPIIIGGIHLTSLPEKTMTDYQYFDIGVIGEGEITIIELLNALTKKTTLEKVKGIIYRENGRLKTTPERTFIENLNELPLPPFNLLSGFPKKYRPSFQKFKRLPSTLLLTSRGCPYQCIYCDSIGLKNSYRSYSTDYILKLVKYLQNDFGIKDINFHDDCFTLQRKNTIKLCNALTEENIGLTWSCQTRVDLVDLELLQLMKKAGCWSVAFGIESGSQKVLDYFKKGITLEKTRQALDWCKSAGLETIGFIIMGHPLETKETMEETLSFLKQININYILPLYFTPFPNSESFTEIEKHGALEKDWNRFTTFNPVFIPRGLSENILNNYQKNIFSSFYLRPNTIIKFLKKIFTGYPLKKIIAEGLTFLKILFRSKK